MSEVVVTGMGVVTSIGVGLDEFWNGLITGRSGVRHRPGMGNSSRPFALFADVQDFEGKKFISPRKALKVMCKPIQFGFAAANLALQHSGCKGNVEPTRFSTLFGTEAFYADPIEVADVFRKCIVNRVYDHDKWGEYSMREIEPLWMLKYLPNMVASHLSIAHDARGPSNTICQSEASSSLAIAEAITLIERGAADVVVAGGTGSPLSVTKSVYVGDKKLSRKVDSPSTACRPFDKRRDGMVMGEGGGCLVLERKDFALARGATIYAELGGITRTFCNPVLPGFSDGLAYTIETAIARSQLDISDIGHINANGFSTVQDDAAEAKAIRKVAGDVPVIAPKSSIGNIGPGTGAVELIASILALRAGTLPPVQNYEYPDSECPINVVAGKPANCSATDSNAALSINHSQAGQIVSIVVKKA